MEIPAKTTLLEEGKTSTHIFFIKKGALRAWSNHNGEDITVLMIETLLQRLRHYSNLFIAWIKLSPEERYLQILQRGPQHYIATYLVITSVSLSHIRNRLLKE